VRHGTFQGIGPRLVARATQRRVPFVTPIAAATSAICVRWYPWVMKTAVAASFLKTSVERP
jgi:hypothetical protein